MLAKAKQIRQNELKMWFIIFICLSSDNNEQVRKGRHKECVCVCALTYSALFIAHVFACDWNLNVRRVQI